MTPAQKWDARSQLAPRLTKTLVKPRGRLSPSSNSQPFVAVPAGCWESSHLPVKWAQTRNKKKGKTEKSHFNIYTVKRKNKINRNKSEKKRFSTLTAMTKTLL